MFKIEKGIPLPKDNLGKGNKGKKGSSTKYPFEKMEVGDSFFVPAPEGIKGKTLGTNIKTASNQWLKAYYPDRLFITRTRVHNNIKGIRVWRVK